MNEKYDVVIEDRGDYIYSKVGGSGQDIDLFVSSVQPAIDLCLRSEHKKLLLEDAIEDDWSPQMMENLVAKLFRAGFDKLFISVYVQVPERQFYTGFAGGVAKSMGMDVEVFINHDDALQRIKNS